jgi:hypothetical protein
MDKRVREGKREKEREREREKNNMFDCFFYFGKAQCLRCRSLRVRVVELMR